MSDENYLNIINSITEQSGVIICVGNLNEMASNDFILLTNLWDLDNNIDYISKTGKKLQDLKRTIDFLRKNSPSNIRDYICPPSVFQFESIGTNSELASILESLQLFTAILPLATNAISKDNNLSWLLQISGLKTIEGIIQYGNGITEINDIDYRSHLSGILKLYHWAFDDFDEAKVRLVRLTIAMDALDFNDFLNNPSRIHNSAVAAYNLYLDQTISEVMKTKQDFTNETQKWIEKDIDMKIKLEGILNEAVYGAIGTIIAIIVGILSQNFSLEAMKIILLSAPLLFAASIVVGLNRIKHVDVIYDQYLDSHMRLIDYYTRILGEQMLLEITDTLKRNEIKQRFSDLLKRNNRIFYILLAISLITWVVIAICLRLYF